jgi:hypothetical protein
MGGSVRHAVTRFVERPSRGLPRVLCLVGVAAFAVSCGSALVPEWEANLVGEIVAVGPDLWNGRDDTLVQVHVKADPHEECGIIFTVDASSRIVDSRGAEPRGASVEILTAGALVAVWYSWAVDTCPEQSWAEVVERRE